MTIEQMKARKAELGYSNEKIAELSKVPLGTVQKIFAGITKAPRYDTIQKLQKVLAPVTEYSPEPDSPSGVAETAYAYMEPQIGHYRNESKGKKPLPIKPRKIKVGMFDGKYKVPPEELFYNDEIAELFEESSDDF